MFKKNKIKKIEMKDILLIIFKIFAAVIFTAAVAYLIVLYFHHLVPNVTVDRPELVNKQVSSRVNINLVGDVLCFDQQLSDSKTDDGYKFNSLSNVNSLFGQQDINIANFIGSISDTEYYGYPGFATPPQFLDAFGNSNFSCFSVQKISNVEKYQNPNKMNFVYSGNDVIITKNNIRCAVISIKYSEYNRREFLEKVQNLLPKSDLTITIIDWGETDDKISDDMQNVSKEMISFGVDFILGINTDSILPIKRYSTPDYNNIEKSRIGYSAFGLGNFLTIQKTDNQDIGAIAALKIVKISDGSARIDKINVIPTFVSSDPDGKNIKITSVLSAPAEDLNEKASFVYNYVNNKTEWDR